MRTALAIVVASLSGCAMQPQVPIPINHAISYQEELRASRHWDLLAADVAEQIKASIASTGNRTVYVDDPAARTDFNRAFQNLLVTQLLNKGLNVSSSRANAVSVSFDTQLVVHRSAAYAGPAPQTEVIVTTSLSDGPRFLTRRTSIYYIPAPDAALFLPGFAASVPRLRDMRITGDLQ